MTSAGIENIPNHLLVIGIDGSGKTTFLNGLQDRFGYDVVEPTSSQAARNFKTSTLDTPLDHAHVTQREKLYLDLNSSFEASILARCAAGGRIATTGSRLVTMVSHDTMGSVIGERDLTAPLETTQAWLTQKNKIKPDSIVFVNAPGDVILGRITDRQLAGDTAEKFWGFNSPFFLLRYQEVWEETIKFIGDNSDIGTLSLDSSKLSPGEMLDSFNAHIGVAT